jgi:hypothetical protein
MSDVKEAINKAIEGLEVLVGWNPEPTRKPLGFKMKNNDKSSLFIVDDGRSVSSCIHGEENIKNLRDYLNQQLPEEKMDAIIEDNPPKPDFIQALEVAWNDFVRASRVARSKNFRVGIESSDGIMGFLVQEGMKLSVTEDERPQVLRKWNFK